MTEEIRTKLARERTKLAWIRTSLTSFIAGLTSLKLIETHLGVILGWGFMFLAAALIIKGIINESSSNG